MSIEHLLKTRIAELRAALMPFAREADQWGDEVPDSFRPLCTEPGSETALPGSETTFTIGNLRRARSLLNRTLSFAPQEALDDGGPAFPWTDAPERLETHQGMSLRDYLAAQALILAHRDYEGNVTARECKALSRETIIAIQAYRIADAMLSVREYPSANRVSAEKIAALLDKELRPFNGGDQPSGTLHAAVKIIEALERGELYFDDHGNAST